MQQIQQGGTQEEIMDAIEKFTLEQFREARNTFKAVHDVDIKRWAIQKSLDFKFRRFKAGHNWINIFKKRNGITSRKIQKIVSNSEIENEAKLKKKEMEFRILVKSMHHQPSSMTWNSDQKGFNYEIVDNSTLLWKGEHRTFGTSFSPRNKATHSYVYCAVCH